MLGTSLGGSSGIRCWDPLSLLAPVTFLLMLAASWAGGKGRIGKRVSSVSHVPSHPEAPLLGSTAGGAALSSVGSPQSHPQGLLHPLPWSQPSERRPTSHSLTLKALLQHLCPKCVH